MWEAKPSSKLTKETNSELKIVFLFLEGTHNLRVFVSFGGCFWCPSWGNRRHFLRGFKIPLRESPTPKPRLLRPFLPSHWSFALSLSRFLSPPPSFPAVTAFWFSQSSRHVFYTRCPRAARRPPIGLLNSKHSEAANRSAVHEDSTRGHEPTAWSCLGSTRRGRGWEEPRV